MTSADLAPAEVLPAQALRFLGLHPDNPATWVLAALARRYALDPLMNELAVISTKQGLKPYVTRDGLLTVAHRSGVFDGMTVEELREGEHGWSATVTVWRKDMSHGFTYSAGCGKHEPQASAGHGADMALARAERRALHRAFNVPTAADEYEADLPAGGGEAREVGTAPSPAPPPPVSSLNVPMMTLEQSQEIASLLTELGLAGLAMREERLAALSEAAGREIEDTRTLTEYEAAMITGTLRARRDALSLDGVIIVRDEEPEPEEPEEPY